MTVRNDETVGQEPADTREEPEPSTNSRPRPSVPLETLAVLNWLGDNGIRGVEKRLNHVLTDDISVTTEQVKVGYAEPRTVPAQFDTEERIGARVLLRTPLGGNVSVLFPVSSANKAASLMLQRAVDDPADASVEMGRDALTELCNMMVNGFIDEWSTLFATTIDTSSPIAVQDTEQALVNRVLKHCKLGLYITSRLRIPEFDVDGAIYVFPGEEQFITKLSRVDLEVING